MCNGEATTMRRQLSITWLMLSSIFSMATAFAQTPAKAWTPPRTSDGHVDLQGVWTNATLTPLQRPPEFAGKEVLTQAEAAAFEKRTIDQSDADKIEGPRSPQDLGRRAYNQAFTDRGTHIVKTRRTSLVVDPPDGRIPPFTAQAQKIYDQTYKGFNDLPANGPEDRLLTERCILFGGTGPPMLVEPYNNNYQIFQTPGTVAILSEMNHDFRLVPTDGRAHLKPSIVQWTGDSRGHWEGDTLVIDSRNFKFNDKSRFGVAYMQGMSDENLHVTERFTRSDANTILYRATVEDTTVYTKPWTVEITMSKRAASEPIYEYACHEGNYGMTGILAGARAGEKK
jgi:hypothetical protein